jgi:hypothetical protein
MALISTLIGSLFGFASFLLAVTVYQTGFLWALAIYSGSGIAIALACILVGMASKPSANQVLTPARG